MKTTLLPLTLCPLCGYRLDAASTVPGEDENATPSPGDITLCFNCVGVLVFDADLHMRAATAAELQVAMEIPELVAAMTAIGAHRRSGQS